MRLVLLVACVIGANAAFACPISNDGPSPCGKLAKNRYVTSTVYVRAAQGAPPVDETTTTSFLAASRWVPSNVDLERATGDLVPKGGKAKGVPSIRFLDAAKITRSPKNTKQLQHVLVRSVEQLDGYTVVDVDGEDYALVACRKGTRKKVVTSCLISRAEAEWHKRPKDIVDKL